MDNIAQVVLHKHDYLCHSEGDFIGFTMDPKLFRAPDDRKEDWMIHHHGGNGPKVCS